MITAIELVNRVSGWVCDLVLGAASRLGPWAGLLFVSFLGGAGALWVIKRVSNQAAVRRTRNRLIARVLELVLYKDDVAGVFGAFGRILWSTGPYLKENLKPLVVLIVPFVLVMTQLAAWYEWRPVLPGESVILTAQLAEDRASGIDTLALSAEPGLEIEAGPVRVPRLREVSWRLRGAAEGEHIATLTGAGDEATKQVVVSSVPAPVSPLRTAGGAWTLLMYPREKRLPTGAGLDRMDLAYPRRDLFFGPWRVHWLIAFFVLTMAFALALRGPMRVEL